jgi:hypothetical protein
MEIPQKKSRGCEFSEILGVVVLFGQFCSAINAALSELSLWCHCNKSSFVGGGEMMDLKVMCH